MLELGALTGALPVIFKYIWVTVSFDVFDIAAVTEW